MREREHVVLKCLPRHEQEGVDVWRPLLATITAAGTYRIISRNETPDIETWAFLTGDIVHCERKQFADGVTARNVPRESLVAAMSGRSASKNLGPERTFPDADLLPPRGGTNHPLIELPLRKSISAVCCLRLSMGVRCIPNVAPTSLGGGAMTKVLGLLVVCVSLGASAAQSSASNLAGHWQGTLRMNR
jgi:hypothetical protein